MNIASLRMESKVLFMPADVTILMPEEAPSPGERLKVVWLLHGAGGDCRTFLYSTDFDGIMKKHRALIVMPSGLNSDYGRYERFGRGFDFPAFFFEELMPFVTANFAASPDPANHYIEGVSMGGYGAMLLGLMHPERFAAIGMLGASLRESPFLEAYRGMDSDCFRSDAMADPRRFPTEYGDPGHGIKPKEVNVITKYPTIQAFFDSPDCMWNRFPEVASAGKLPQIYVACGTRDLFYEPVCRFRALTERLGVQDKVYFKIAEGVGHDEAFFDQEIGCFMDHYHI